MICELKTHYLNSKSCFLSHLFDILSHTVFIYSRDYFELSNSYPLYKLVILEDARQTFNTSTYTEVAAIVITEGSDYDRLRVVVVVIEIWLRGHYKGTKATSLRWNEMRRGARGAS